MVGMPLALADRLSTLRERLSERALLAEGDLKTLLDRLQVTMSGIDVRPARPNAVVLLIGDAATQSEALAEMVAASLFGAEEREVAIDLSRFVHREDVTMLVGAPPGYVGYGDVLALHRVAQMPWCVVRLENIEACHRRVREVLQRALADGFITDACGKRIYLSDTVVLLTARIAVESGGRIGFQTAESSPALTARQAAEQALGVDFVAQTDLVCAEVPSSETTRRRWIEKYLLAELAERYRKRGLDLRWDESFVQWLLLQCSSVTRRALEHVVDQRLGPLVVSHLDAPEDEGVRSVKVEVEGDSIRVKRHGTQIESPNSDERSR
jgi:ATP-dependent Clp protease ATP-binding subunit ClpC